MMKEKVRTEITKSLKFVVLKCINMATKFQLVAEYLPAFAHKSYRNQFHIRTSFNPNTFTKNNVISKHKAFSWNS